MTAFPFYAYRPGEAAPSFRSAERWSGVLSLLSGWAVMALMAAGMGGGLPSLADVRILTSAISDTGFGRVWMARIVLSIVILAMIVRPRPARNKPLLIASGLLLVSVALTGHSALPGGAPAILHRVADAVHLLAAGWWIGGLLALVMTARTLGSGAAQVLERFSGVGYGAVAAVVLSGLFKSVLLVASFEGADSTAYGWTLLLKVALVAAMGALALANRFWITPGLKRGGDPGPWLAHLHRSVSVEFALGLAVLAVVGALGAMSPPISS